MSNKIIETILLPTDISKFEATYLQKVNRIALIFFACHVPVLALVAWANQTRPALAALLAALVLLGPLTAYYSFDNPRHTSTVHGVSAMFMGALLVHFGQGPAQIEMHFYFFALIAMCAVFANPMVIVAATIAVALHHFIVWLVLPASVFNYDAHLWVVGVHALFVVLEAAATCFIARSFFDNVIGLEKIVQARTLELDTKNRDMRMLLDNVQQGFLTIDRSGRLAAERSAAVDRWFGAPVPTSSWFDYLERIAPKFAVESRVGWQEVVDDVMPLEMTLEQMPRELSAGEATYGIAYQPIGDAATLFQVCITDISEHIRSERSDEDRREVMAIFERVLADRSGLEAFIAEGTRIVRSIRETDLAVVKLALHTLKGTSSMFGLATLAHRCHLLEDTIADSDAVPSETQCQSLVERWSFVVAEVEKLLGCRGDVVEIDRDQVRALEAAARARDTSAMANEIERLHLESVEKRFKHVAGQAELLAARLGKAGLVVRIESNHVRLEPTRWSGFWQTFVHGVRNAIDHGIEPAEERGNKPASGTLVLRSYTDARHVVIEIEDDGRGIDWAKVGIRARAHGLPSTTHEELTAALFVGGFTTTSEVTDISGRGIGMGALLAGTHALGGELDVTSQAGVGTTIRMKFPLEAAFGETRLAIAS